MQKRNVIALCGPSGVGKGFTKNLIRENANGVEFTEPAFATTRPARGDDSGHRLAGLSIDEFNDMVDAGMVIIPSQPFGEGTPYYGLVETSIKSGNILTEVHPCILKDFKEYFKDDNLLILAMEATDEFLRESMTGRGTGDDIELRVAKSKDEIAQIREAMKEGLIDGLWNINFAERDNAQRQIVECTKQWLKSRTHSPRIQVNERRQPMEQENSNKLRSTFLGTEYSSPIVVASGDLTETPEEVYEYINAGAGAVVPRTTRLHMIRDRHPVPNLYQSGDNLISCQWTGADIDYWKPHLEKMSEGDKVIMSVSGRNMEDCVKVCKELDQYRFPALEVNISCAASGGVHGMITRNMDFVTELTSRIKDAGVKTPISLKLGHSDGIVDIANAAKEAGADAITAINTMGPVFDFIIDENGRPQRIAGIAGSKAGLAGRAIFNTALTDVADISRQVGIPVMASGGVMEPEDAIKMIMSGASLVQLYTKLHNSGIYAPQTLTKFNEGLLEYMNERNIPDIASAQGSALYLLDLPTNLIAQIPAVDKSKCNGCKLCRQVCLNHAAYIPNQTKKAEIDHESCTGCGHCVSVCPEEALSQTR